ncbi:patatin-like phospholipase family protein [Aquimarina sp. 2201CG14-23]|uniref:patatin-like phospholipase family protein n=1 Tax=Aquimarina mycalae TaxID=3040073 RepID=UPI002477F629|nr:patatin-like phospholipase family protein [Aquimarina sp. 2201CG14-23]MDH7444155.1 patatin-like phospholipase family protein [Aquimarina sp. 2201CG14-23]
MNIIQQVMDWLHSFFVSFNKFRRSSLLSIIVLIVILLMVKGFDQSYTLLIDMIERDQGSLILCYVLIAMFALVLSHYPIYVYYAKDINNSKDDHLWYVHLWLRLYPIYTFQKKTGSYTPDYLSKYFRYCLGLAILCIWHFYIYKSFLPKFLFVKENLGFIQLMNWVFCIVPFILLAYALYLKGSQKKELNKKGTLLFFVNFIVVIILLIAIAFCEFSYATYWLLQITTFMISLLYVLFRLYRGEIARNYSIPILRYISDVFNYLLVFFIFSIFVFSLLVYCNFAVSYDLPIVNAMAILLSYFYIIYYLLACILKYVFVIDVLGKQQDITMSFEEYRSYVGVDVNRATKLIDFEGQKRIVKRGKKIISLSIVLVIISLIVSFTTESNIHKLNTSDTTISDKKLSLKTFEDTIHNKVDKPLFFVASHGGALKANIWTMKLLNTLQKNTDGVFLDQTVSFSGASGGMMGLSLYSVLAGKYNDYSIIDDRIEKVALEKFASKDLSYTFGYDLIRKFWPFKKFGTYRDRAYYSMVKYQNLLEADENSTNRDLTTESFQSYWYNNIFNSEKNDKKYFPALIVNTAKTNGRRGVFCSLNIEPEKKVFFNVDNLSQLENDKEAVAFYEAVSTTNRFPLFSPAAKISGHGHYIDGGAIDNSGLLSTLDLYNYLNQKEKFKNARKVFVEIINGKSIYINHLIKRFKQNNPEVHLEFNEIEQDNIIADAKTGFNLDKIPNYLSEFMQDMSEKDPTVEYIPIYLPRKINIDDLQQVVGGKFGKDLKEKLEKFLKEENNKILAYTDQDPSNWDTYEPTLARHLSKSTIKYYDKVLEKDNEIKNNIECIKVFLGINN